MNDMKEKATGAVGAFLERKGYEIVDEARQGPEGIDGLAQFTPRARAVNSPNLICLSHTSRRWGGAFSRESIPVLLMRTPVRPYACCSVAFETSKLFDFRN